MFWAVLTTIIALFMAITMNLYRLKAARRPTSVKKIILPPLFMSTGALMFIFPMFQIEWLQVVEALIIGMIFSILLIGTSKFETQNQDIYLIPSKSFVFILFGLLAVRILAKLLMNQRVPLGETSGMFYLLALGMITSWRLGMLYKYKKIEASLKNERTTSEAE